VSRFALIRVVLLTAIAVMAAAVWATGQVQSSADRDSTAALTSGQRMLIAMLDQETGLRGYINTHRFSFLDPYRTGRNNFDRFVTEARANASDRGDLDRIDRQVMIARQWQALAEPTLAEVAAGREPSVASMNGRKAAMDRFRQANSDFIAHKRADSSADRSRGQAVAVAIVVALGALFALIGWLTFERPARREAKRRRRAAEFGDALQVARSEREAFNVLKRHLERWLHDATAVVLVRNSSANRLQAATGLEQTPVLAERLEGAAPESCLSVRLAKPFSRGEDDGGLLQCEICGGLPKCSSCVPTIVGGEVVGSVLVQTRSALGGAELDELTSSVGTAGPAIANLRNLAIAELRAATDALTGLANHRSVQDTLNRMVAQAGRIKTPLAAVLFDLDHFKKVNDIHGHAKGDEVLATVGATVGATVRDSDFIGRYGGEEFVALLPDTNREGGVNLAEKLRQAIEALEIPDLDRRLSASFGVAVLPGDAVNGEQLMRAADRALYAAKNAGRNRVEVVTATSGQGRTEAPERA
jgi:diguanylate cyclase (GGDEF)-like protein